MVLREGLVVTAIGVVIGVLGAVALSRVLSSLVFGVSALDPRVMAGAAVFMGVVGGVGGVSSGPSCDGGRSELGAAVIGVRVESHHFSALGSESGVRVTTLTPDSDPNALK